MLQYGTGICCYAIIYFCCCCFCPFLFILFFLNLVLINRRNGPRYQRVLALCALFNRGNTDGTNSSKNLCLMFVYLLFYMGLCQD